MGQHKMTRDILYCCTAGRHRWRLKGGKNVSKTFLYFQLKVISSFNICFIAIINLEVSRNKKPKKLDTEHVGAADCFCPAFTECNTSRQRNTKCDWPDMSWHDMEPQKGTCEAALWSPGLTSYTRKSDWHLWPPTDRGECWEQVFVLLQEMFALNNWLTVSVWLFQVERLRYLGIMLSLVMDHR